MCGIGVESAGAVLAPSADRICGTGAGNWQVPQRQNTHKIRRGTGRARHGFSQLVIFRDDH
jgi:hypothetical protein